VLKQKATEGVKIYILLYNAFNLAFAFAPAVEKAKEFLEAIHPNVKVVATP